MSTRKRPKRGGGGEAGTGAAPEGSVVIPGSSVSDIEQRVKTLLVYESSKKDADRVDELANTLGYRTIVVDDRDRAVAILQGNVVPEVVLAGIPGGEEVARAARNRGDDRPAVVLAFSGHTDEAIRRADLLGADTFVLRPHKRESLAPILRLAALLRAERMRGAILSTDLETERRKPLRMGEVDPETGFHQFEFFKTLLVLELKRAKRYGYSLAACLVAIDGGVGDRKDGGVHAQVARALRGVIRDIDMPVDYADGKFLVFLPYTDLAGAERVGNRLEATVRSFDTFDDDGSPITPTVSVGIAALKPGRQVSFAKLVRDASSALRAAQLKGGGRVVVRQ